MGMEMKREVVILGVGNLLLRDEGIGIHAIRELQAHYAFEENVCLIDGGTGGLGLLPAIQGAEHLIVLDAVQADRPPGSIFQFTLADIPCETSPQLSPHELDLPGVLKLAEALCQAPASVIFFGAQPQEVSCGLELTPSVQSAIPVLVQLVLGELDRLRIGWRRLVEEEKCPMLSPGR